MTTAFRQATLQLLALCNAYTSNTCVAVTAGTVCVFDPGDIWWEALSVATSLDMVARRPIKHRQVLPETVFDDCRMNNRRRLPPEVPRPPAAASPLGASPEG